jgi:hypothetical protein
VLGRFLSNRRPFVVCAIAAMLAACHATSHATSEAVTIVPSGNHSGVYEVRRGVASVCNVYGTLGPPSYLVSDMGKPGAPVPDSSDVTTLHKMLRYVHSATLRYAFLGNEFIVYDAVNGPYSMEVPYAVLNERSCNAMYAPVDRPDALSASTGCWG